MRKITSQSCRGSVLESWRNVFLKADPFGWPFAEEIKCGRLIFPTDGYFLSRRQFDCLAASAGSIGESSCYLVISEVLGEGGSGAGFDACVLDLCDYKSYAALTIPLENSIFSMSGAWGLMISHEMHAILGGSREFIASYNRACGLKNQQWQEFAGLWSDKRHEGWVSEISAYAGPGQDC